MIKKLLLVPSKFLFVVEAVCKEYAQRKGMPTEYRYGICPSIEDACPYCQILYRKDLRYDPLCHEIIRDVAEGKTKIYVGIGDGASAPTGLLRR